MKRYKNLYNEIISVENLKIADNKARKGKRKQYGVRKHLENEEENILNLNKSLINRDFTTSEYKTFKIFEGKEREIFQLPYFPDRIVHHSIMNILEPIFVSIFTADTYSCIKGRGVHSASYKLRKILKKDVKNTKYCLKIDIRKFYPSIDNSILKTLLRRKFKDKDLLYLLDNIIDSTKGVAIGNYTSQFFANFYLTYFDHWIKEDLKVKYFFRYCDDIIILSDDKDKLWEYFYHIKHYHTHVLIRKSIKKKYIKNKKKINHKGWLIHADTVNLRNKYERVKN